MNLTPEMHEDLARTHYPIIRALVASSGYPPGVAREAFAGRRIWFQTNHYVITMEDLCAATAVVAFVKCLARRSPPAANMLEQRLLQEFADGRPTP